MPGAVLADGLLLFVVAMLGLGLGAIVRHTAGGIAALVGVIFLPAILAVLPPPWGGRVGRFTLVDAARQVTALHPATNLFAPALVPAGPAGLARRRAAGRRGRDHPPRRLSWSRTVPPGPFGSLPY